MDRRESRGSRAKVLRAAIGLSRPGGLDSFSMNELGERLGLSKSNLYRHFESRAELLAEAVLAYADALAVDAMTASARAPRGIRRLMLMLDFWLGHYVTQGGCLILRAASDYAGRAEDPVSLSIKQAVIAWRSVLTSQLQDAAHSGEICGSIDHQHLHFEIFSFILGIHNNHLFLDDLVLADCGYAVRDCASFRLKVAHKASAWSGIEKLQDIRKINTSADFRHLLFETFGFAIGQRNCLHVSASAYVNARR